MTKLFSFTRISIIFAHLMIGGFPAVAATGTYEKPALGPAILAKVLGNVCPQSLTTSEAAEVQTFIHLWMTTVEEIKPLPDFNRIFVQGLEESYTEKYSVPGVCLEEAAKTKAQAILQRIRKASSDPVFWADLREWAARSL